MNSEGIMCSEKLKPLTNNIETSNLSTQGCRDWINILKGEPNRKALERSEWRLLGREEMKQSYTPRSEHRIYNFQLMRIEAETYLLQWGITLRSCCKISTSPPSITSSKYMIQSSKQSCWVGSQITRQKKVAPKDPPAERPQLTQGLFLPKKERGGRVAWVNIVGERSRTEQSILSRWMELNALRKSSFNMTWPGWRLQRYLAMSDMNRRLSTTPHTIAKLTRSQEGWHITQDNTWGNLGHQTPQSASHSNKVNSTSLLLMAVNLAPKNKWWISTGVSPFKTRDIKVVMKKERRGQTYWGH